MKILKIKSNGSLTIPARLRKKYGLHAERKVKFEITEDGIKIIPLVTSEEIKANIGFLGTKGKLLKALMGEQNFEKKF
jgi:AbrB family looped-hinge helix DNA binding protein